MTPQWFDDEMKYLADNGYHAVTADELVGYVEGTSQLPAKSVVLTFDLGTPQSGDFDKIIVPTLEKYGLHGVFFVTTDSVKDECGGGSYCWSMLKSGRRVE